MGSHAHIKKAEKRKEKRHTVIDGIEAQQRRKQSDICLREAIAGEVSAVR